METQFKQPLHACEDGLMNAASGTLIDINNPMPEMFNIDDIAKGLSNTCRFGGQLGEFYSVAQHSLLVCKLAPTHLKRAALLHDASEAYLCDIPKPVKHILGDSYKSLEERFMRAIFKRFKIPYIRLSEIKEYDMKVLELEDAYLRGGDEHNKKLFTSLMFGQPGNPVMNNQLAFFAFKSTYHRLF